ncbi:SDR family oxidoreductase [Qipengyuania vesicularis]|uniref:SDR family oxidoreductase n=1 Tax=Qipengyuania vesicularis TaxID=2867232 RepID=UPI001C889B13|nr:SDR family oxidoreductase [Qipengyuania vesicularis]MBX7526942.1 SDR family oxidoreductase [Qipengyuania vesicularis]
MSKIVLTTGCSTGLGASIAVAAAKAGWKSYASMRNLSKRGELDKMAEAAGTSVELLELDVCDQASIDAAVSEIIEREGRIDTLVCNAGVGFVRSTEQAEESDVQWVMDTNFHGVVRCTKAVLPHMRAAGAGHVVAITSIGGLVGQPFNEIYCGSKFAVEGYIEGLASYAGPAFGLHFTAIEPAGISSEFAANVREHIAKSGGMLDDAYAPILKRYLSDRSGPEYEGLYQTPGEVAQVVLDIMASNNPPVRARTSSWAENFCRFKTETDPDGRKQQRMVIDTFLGGSAI